jgi:hypothetical protein
VTFCLFCFAPSYHLFGHPSWNAPSITFHVAALLLYSAAPPSLCVCCGVCGAYHQCTHSVLVDWVIQKQRNRHFMAYVEFGTARAPMPTTPAVLSLTAALQVLGLLLERLTTSCAMACILHNGIIATSSQTPKSIAASKLLKNESSHCCTCYSSGSFGAPSDCTLCGLPTSIGVHQYALLHNNQPLALAAIFSPSPYLSLSLARSLSHNAHSCLVVLFTAPTKYSGSLLFWP